MNKLLIIVMMILGMYFPTLNAQASFENPRLPELLSPSIGEATGVVYAVIEGDPSHPPVNDVVILTGDIHSSWAADLSRDPNNPNVATGGYDPASGFGSRAVEFVGTSISSPGVNDPNNGIATQLRTINPHFKHIDLNRRGYMLLDATPERVVCEWWYVETVQVPSPLQTFGTAFEVRAGTNRLAPAAQTTPPAAPALAP